MHKVCFDALRGICIPSFALHIYYTNHFYSRPSPRWQGGRQQGKCAAFLKKQFCRVAIFVFMRESFVTTSQPRGIAGTLTFCQANPCQKPTLRGQSVGKTAAVSPAVCCLHYTAFFAFITQIPHHGDISVQVFPDFHLTYSKNGGNLGSESK